MLSHEDGERNYLHSMTRRVWDYGSCLGFQIFLFLVMKFTYPSRKWLPGHINSFISTLFYYWWCLATLPLLYNMLHMSLHLHCLLFHPAGVNPTENSVTKQRQAYCHTSVFYFQIYHVLGSNCCCCLVAKSCPILWPHGLYLTRLCPWGFPGKNTEVGYHFLLSWISQTQRLNLCLLHWQADFFFFNWVTTF